jgi:hypothetical protein
MTAGQPRGAGAQQAWSATVLAWASLGTPVLKLEPGTISSRSPSLAIPD